MCYQWVRRGGKVTGDNLGARCRVTTFNECDGGPESRPGIFPWLCRDVVARYHSFRLPSLLMGRRRLLTVSSLLVLPPQQRIQCRAAASFNQATTLESQVIHKIQELSGQTLSNSHRYHSGGADRPWQ